MNITRGVINDLWPACAIGEASVDAQVTLEVLGAVERDGLTVLTTKVDGAFDRTGLPDPLILEHVLRIKDNKIAALTCRLAGASPA